MSHNPLNRRIAPASNVYQRRNRRMLVAAPMALFTLLAGGALWWFAEEIDLHLPSWQLSGNEELSLGAEERDSLRQQLDMLRTQWLRLDSLDAMQQKQLAPLTPSLKLALGPTANLSDQDLRDRVDVLSKGLDERLFAPAVSGERKTGSGRLMPVAGVRPSSNFGLRLDPFSGRATMHNGIDFVAPIGTPVYAADSGVVKSAGLTPQFGWSVEIDHGRGVTTRYAHAFRLWVRPGQQVGEGQKIAEVGSTGKSTGPHLHFEVRYNGAPLNPMRYLALR